MRRTPQEKERVLTLNKDGLSIRAISTTLNVPSATVHFWINESERSLKKEPVGRPRKLPDGNQIGIFESLIRDSLKHERIWDVNGVTKKISDNRSIYVSRQSIYRLLRRWGVSLKNLNVTPDLKRNYSEKSVPIVRVSVLSWKPPEQFKKKLFAKPATHKKNAKKASEPSNNPMPRWLWEAYGGRGNISFYWSEEKDLSMAKKFLSGLKSKFPQGIQVLAQTDQDLIEQAMAG